MLLISDNGEFHPADHLFLHLRTVSNFSMRVMAIHLVATTYFAVAGVDTPGIAAPASGQRMRGVDRAGDITGIDRVSLKAD